MTHTTVNNSLDNPDYPHKETFLPILRKYPTKALNKIWLNAAKIGEDEICEAIEEVVFERRERWIYYAN